MAIAAPEVPDLDYQGDSDLVFTELEQAENQRPELILVRGEEHSDAQEAPRELRPDELEMRKWIGLVGGAGPVYKNGFKGAVIAAYGEQYPSPATWESGNPLRGHRAGLSRY